MSLSIEPVDAAVSLRGVGPRRWPGSAVMMGALVAAAGLAQLFTGAGWGAAPQLWLPRLVLAVVVGASLVAAGRAPGVAVALVWLAGVVQILNGLDVLFAQLSVVVVAFAAARWGTRAAVWASGASIPAGCAAVAGYAMVRSAALTNPVGTCPLG